MFPLAEEAMKTLANFHSTVMAGLDPAIQSQLERPCFFWMAASKGGHDDGIGGNIRVIRFRKGEALSGIVTGWARAASGRDDECWPRLAEFP